MGLQSISSMHASRKNGFDQDRAKRALLSDEFSPKSSSGALAASSVIGNQRVSEAQKHRHRDLLPALDDMRSKVLSVAEPEAAQHSMSERNCPSVSTSAPSESPSVLSSRRSSSSSHSRAMGHASSLASGGAASFVSTTGDWRCPAPPADFLLSCPRQPARSQSVGGTSSRATSRAGSRTPGHATPEPGSRAPSASGSRAASNSSRMPQIGMSMIKTSGGGAVSAVGDQKQDSGRCSSGTRTPEQSGRGRIAVQPLTNAQLESASKKLRSLDDSDIRPPRRTSCWDVDDDEDDGRRDATVDKGGNEETLSSLTPTAPSGTRGSKNKNRGRPGGTISTASTGSFSTGGSSSSSNSRTLKPAKDARHQTNPRLHLRNGSRDDSFLSTISESTRSTDSTSTDRDSKINVADGSQIEVYSENQAPDRRMYMDVLKDFHQMFKQFGEKDAETMQHLLRSQSFDKPLEIQRRIIPLIMSAFQDEQKSFMTLQGAPQCGKTSALALGILGAVRSDMPGIRIVALSTGSVRDFKKVFEICAEVHPVKLSCFESAKRRVSFEGVDPDPDSSFGSINVAEDMQKLSSDLGSGAPGVVFGHPSRVLPLMREALAWGIDLSNVQVLALDDAEESICHGLIDEVCEVCTILRHFSKQRLRHIVLSHFLSNEAKSMVRCLRTSLLRQQNLFGIRAHQTQARAKAVNHYYAVAPRARWPAMLAVLHHALSLPSGIIFDDESADARAHTRLALRALGVTASVWNALQEQRSGARAAARDGASSAPKGPAFHLMPSDLVVLKVDLPQVRCVLHFEVPRRELSIYGLRLMCLEQQDQKKSKKAGLGGKSLSVLFVEEAEVVRELEKTFHIRMHEVPTEMLPS